MKDIQIVIKELALYAEKKGLTEPSDRSYIINRLIERMGLSAFDDPALDGERDLEDILEDLCDYAYEKGLIAENSVTYRDLFDTSLMGILTPRPSEVQKKFFSLYKEQGAEAATDYFVQLAYDSDYIRTYRVKRDLTWKAPSRYGEMDITVNLSKPEKDPRAIAAAKLLPQSGYPKCLLCHENEGYAGTLASPARQNLRQIPLTMGDTPWYLQYSPYVYYNEHCIALSALHTPMKIDESTFVKMLDFVSLLPHYFIGSNADLPIVGGSILSHDHMQGGRYCFAMERAEIEIPLTFAGYPEVSAGIVHWPMAVIRLSSENRESLTALASHILREWRAYTDESAFILAESDGEKHNTVTPIARMREGKYELDLVLRNNITTDEHPLGVYHPHAELHHIKRENIGLIEVMGLAVLPARLKNEIEWTADAIVKGKNIEEDERISPHAAWAREICARRTDLTAENVTEILKEEIGAVFVRVLEDAGVYKTDREGREAFLRFARQAGAR
ncbi:MAG: UDP-glucose--hexose-1-phosphate uridylyltransferase [Clostridia bacterium]|nr:UDP-glucose--hexose-1-phosphate uridylyltransferase [Clostridia bacterium]